MRIHWANAAYVRQLVEAKERAFRDWQESGYRHKAHYWEYVRLYELIQSYRAPMVVTRT